jgi:hypothetical protein
MAHMIRVLVLVAGLFSTAPAWSWARAGHETVGAIAEQLLEGTNAARRVRSLLLPNETLASAALWADCVKAVAEEPPHRYRADPRFPECEIFATKSGQREMSAYVRRNLVACGPEPGEETCHRQYHYVNLATQRERYQPDYAGASDHDIVAALGACIAVLRGQRAPPVFELTQREALRLLAHLVGDIHQPLHVGSVYLTAEGQLLDPDTVATEPASFTAGSNRVRVGARNLHALWDETPSSLGAAALLGAGVRAARDVPPMTGTVETWPSLWAGESVQVSDKAFDGVSFLRASSTAQAPAWRATLPEGYEERREAIQREQLVRAGARLAQVLLAIWP